MSDPSQKAEQYFQDALRDIRLILNAVHATATPGERVTRIAWVIGSLPEGLRESVIAEAQNRVTIGWAAGLKPTDW
jgi:hypothetical protein